MYPHLTCDYTVFSVNSCAIVEIFNPINITVYRTFSLIITLKYKLKNYHERTLKSPEIEPNFLNSWINKRDIEVTFIFCLLSELIILLKSLIAMAKREVKLAYLGKYGGGSKTSSFVAYKI